MSTYSLNRPADRVARRGLISAPLSRIDRDILVILALPLLLILANEDWIVASAGWLDPWFYFGYFLNLPQHLRVFPDVYYGTRLPWILPGYLAHWLFPPVVATYLLHVGFSWIALISLYSILKSTINRRAALLASLLVGSYPFFLSAYGWDYVDGAGVSYLLLAMWLLISGARSTRWRPLLCLSGVSFAAAVWTNTFLVAFAPLIGACYLIAQRVYARNPLCGGLALFLTGILGLTLLLGIINYLMVQEFLFFWPSVRFALLYANQPNPWRDPSYDWIRRAWWLLLPCLTLVGALVHIFTNRQRRVPDRFAFSGFFQLSFVSTLLIMALLELKGNPVLQKHFYASYLIPGMFLAIGSLLGGIVGCLSSRQFSFLAWSTFLVLLFFSSLPFGPLLAEQVGRGVRPPLVLAIVLLVPALAVRAKVASLLVLFLCLGLLNSTWVSGRALDLDRIREQQSQLLAVEESMRIIQTVNPEGDIRIWYNKESPLLRVYEAVASTYLWEYRLVNAGFPSLADTEIRPGRTIAAKIGPGDKIAILSDGGGALGMARESLAQTGLSAQFLAERNVELGRIRFALTFIEVVGAKVGNGR